jgi:hypothetical protein
MESPFGRRRHSFCLTSSQRVRVPRGPAGVGFHAAPAGGAPWFGALKPSAEQGKYGGEQAEALRDWRDALERERILLREKMRVDEAGVEEPARDPQTWPIAEEDLAARKLAAAKRLDAAGKALRAVQAVDANEKLSELAPLHEDAVAGLELRREAFAEAQVGLIVAAEFLFEAFDAERRAAKKMVRIAAELAPNDQMRDGLHQVRDGLRENAATVPLALGEAGPTLWRDRPATAFYAGADDVSDPRSERFWTQLGRSQSEADGTGPRSAANACSRSWSGQPRAWRRNDEVGVPHRAEGRAPGRA